MHLFQRRLNGERLENNNQKTQLECKNRYAAKEISLDFQFNYERVLFLMKK